MNRGKKTKEELTKNMSGTTTTISRIPSTHDLKTRARNFSFEGVPDYNSWQRQLNQRQKNNLLSVELCAILKPGGKTRAKYLKVRCCQLPKCPTERHEHVSINLPPSVILRLHKAGVICDIDRQCSELRDFLSLADKDNFLKLSATEAQIKSARQHFFKPIIYSTLPPSSSLSSSSLSSLSSSSSSFSSSSSEPPSLERPPLPPRNWDAFSLYPEAAKPPKPPALPTTSSKKVAQGCGLANCQKCTIDKQISTVTERLSELEQIKNVRNRLSEWEIKNVPEKPKQLNGGHDDEDIVLLSSSSSSSSSSKRKMPALNEDVVPTEPEEFEAWWKRQRTSRTIQEEQILALESGRQQFANDIESLKLARQLLQEDEYQHQPKLPSLPLPLLTEYKKQEEPTSLSPVECVVCTENRPSVAFLPCGHCYVCQKCATPQIVTCPACRGPIHERVIIHLP
jgi:hypothetical protein